MEPGAPRRLTAAGQPPAAGRPDELDATVGQLERLCNRLEQAEQQFKRLTDQCEGVLHGLVDVDHRHSAAIASLNERLGDWCNLEGKLLAESARRIERFERGVSHEWMVLRRLNEEPIVEMRAQADALRQACLEAAQLARLRLGAEPAPAPAYPASSPGVEPWSFEGVAQLHQEVRSDASRPVAAAPGREPVVQEIESPRGDPDTVLPGAEEAGPGVEPMPGARRWTRWVLALGGLGLGVLLGFLVLTSGGPRTPDPVSPRGPAPAARQTTAEAAPKAPAIEEPDPRILEAQRAAERAAVLVDILAAPDLRRYALGGLGATPAAYAQALWSRTRGLAVTASRLPAAPAGTVYQVWIRSAARTASAGTFAPDANGRASLVVPGPLDLPQPGAIRVTLEPEPGSPQPSGQLALAGGPAV